MSRTMAGSSESPGTAMESGFVPKNGSAPPQGDMAGGSIGHDDSDHSLLRSHHRIESKKTDIIGVPHQATADAAAPGLLHAHRHRPVGSDLAQSVATIDQAGGQHRL